MRNLIVLVVHFITTVLRIAQPGGLRSVIAESVLIKHQLLIVNRSRRRAPNLRVLDRLITCRPQKIHSGILNAILMQQFSPARTRDADHRGSMSPQLGSPSECNAVVLEALPSVNSDPVFQVQDWSADGRDCNAPPNI